ncbi:MAG: hypothetical protein IKZ99_01710 [Salinivirgaceae bacterium]|nr:hypothetical protein [Salinivirgaceae bacterium]
MLTIVIAIVLLIVGKFIYDLANQSQEVASQGGVRKKYAVLIDCILSGHENARIYRNENNFVAVGVSNMAGSTMFYIQQTFGKVTIQCEVKNNPIIGFFKKEWTFPEDMDQYLMWQKMNNDIGSMLL